ncbi:hypothetical protein HZA97_08135 [Candidatus Woesearchaeota archaeon]|nr:hypothetical protein [Candidatus Woesearchaeota archaeon]
MSEKNILSVGELIERTYQTLSNKHNHEELSFQNNEVRTEIADDSDWHRTRTGYMRYKRAGIFNLKGNTRVIAKGEACGSYPADPYDSDILAFEFLRETEKDSLQVREDIIDKIAMSSYFKNSLLCGMSDGSLTSTKKMFELLKPELNNFIAETPKYDPEFLSLSTLSPICTSSVKYKPEFAEFLANSIEAILNDKKTS